ncbi:MAG: hypothetical protein HYZ29_37330 [Myxococcales bacterium]|nr:hypothetical protein [Myxococcales bacterium]
MASRSAAALAPAILAFACGGPTPASSFATPPEYASAGEAKCKIRKNQSKPLVVEWPSGDRAELEARTRTGVVVVRYSGCELRILPECSTKGAYAYMPVTPKSDLVTIHDEDELYANIPVGAAGLEGTLKKTGQLNVSTTTVGRYVAYPSAVYRDELKGGCAGATHIISGFTVGAFEFFAGANASGGGGVSVLGAGVGASSRAQRSTLSADGDARACRSAGADPTAPPAGCGALVRLEVAEILAPGQARSTHNSKSRVGTWVAAGKMCNGVGVQTHGLRQTLVVGETELTATMSTQNCTVTNARVPIRGDDVLVGAGKIGCAPNPCTISYKASANDGSSFDFSKVCPDELPIVMPVLLGGGGDQLFLTTGDANVACLETFVRQGGAPETQASSAPKLTAELPPEPKAVPRDGRRPAPVLGAGPSHTASYVLGGIGVAGVTVGLVTGGMALGKKNTVDSECDGATRTCTQEGLDAAKSGRTLTAVSNVSFAVGVVSLGAAIYLILDADEAPSVAVLRGPGPRGRGTTFNGVRW